jgi:hypothetical protein
MVVGNQGLICGIQADDDFHRVEFGQEDLVYWHPSHYNQGI